MVSATSIETISQYLCTCVLCLALFECASATQSMEKKKGIHTDGLCMCVFWLVPYC